VDQSIVNTLIALFGGLIGWLLKVIWGAVRDLQDADDQIINKVNGLEVLVAGDYVKREELRAEFAGLKQTLSRIENKLDQKADK
jgi:hypothetical protein